MNWLKALVRSLFIKKNIKQLDLPKDFEKNDKNDFKIMLKQQANLEADDGNGYKIKTNIKLKDRI